MARVSIEDCQKIMPNRFALVIVAANRARQLMGSSPPLVHSRNKHQVTALREIAEGKIIAKGPAIGSDAMQIPAEDPRHFPRLDPQILPEDV